MTKPLKQVAGIDVAKNELVVSLGRMNPDTSIEVFANKCFANTNKGFSDLMAWVTKMMSKETRVMFVMEATGIYHEAFAYYLFDKNQQISIVLPNKISSYARTLDVMCIPLHTLPPFRCKVYQCSGGNLTKYSA